jgi:hypothetical protein
MIRLARARSGALALLLLGGAIAPAEGLDRSIAAHDLQGRTLRELSLMRNEIYARHGQPFRRAWLREYFEAQPWYEAGAPVSPADLTPQERSNAERIGVFEAALTREELSRRKDDLQNAFLQGAPRNPEQEIEWTLLNERLGEDSILSPARLESRLHQEELKDLSLRDLAVLRHMIAARRGRILPSESLRKLFHRFEWYSPDPEYTDSRLNAIDRENLEIIASLERSIGGPIADDDPHWLAAP